MHVPYTWCTEFPVPLALAQTIASTQGAHLRSLHFGPQVPISIELAERLLSHLPLLETCRFQKLRFPYPFPHSSDDVSDDEDEVVIESPGFQDRVDGAEEEEYKDVQRTATWPEGRRPIRLPFLRSLECRIFPINVGQWELPALTHVMAGFDRSYLQDSPTAPLQIGLGPHVSRITHLTFRGAGDTDLWSVVGPCMVYFDFEIHGLWVESKLAVPLPYLQTIVIYKPRASSSASSLSAVLDNISENITEDKLPALRYVRLTGFKARAKGIPDQHMQFGAWGVDQRERFAAWGVELDLLPGEGD